MGEVEDFISHYGKKGMKWGVRNSRRPVPGTKAAISRDKQIDAARERFASGANRRRYVQAKTKYKHQRVTKGKNFAKRELQKAKLKNLRDAQVANTAKDGKEFATFLAYDVLSGGGVTLANVGINTYARRLEKKVG